MYNLDLKSTSCARFVNFTQININLHYILDQPLLGHKSGLSINEWLLIITVTSAVKLLVHATFTYNSC